MRRERARLAGDKVVADALGDSRGQEALRLLGIEDSQECEAEHSNNTRRNIRYDCGAGVLCAPACWRRQGRCSSHACPSRPLP